MGATNFSGPVVSAGGFTGDLTGNVTGDVSGANLGVAPVNLTAATLTLAPATHGGRIVTVNKADGTAITLPAPTGSGVEYRLFIGTTITSNSTTIKVAAAADTMSGVALVANDTDNSASLFETAANSDTITLNGTTTGGILGDFIELIDVATNKWFVRVTASASGTEATPFSATVS